MRVRTEVGRGFVPGRDAVCDRRASPLPSRRTATLRRTGRSSPQPLPFTNRRGGDQLQRGGRSACREVQGLFPPAPAVDGVAWRQKHGNLETRSKKGLGWITGPPNFAPQSDDAYVHVHGTCPHPFVIAWHHPTHSPTLLAFPKAKGGGMR